MQKTINKDKVKAMRATLNELLSVPIRKDRRQKYLTGGLVNLADNLVKKEVIILSLVMKRQTP